MERRRAAMMRDKIESGLKGGRPSESTVEEQRVGAADQR
jgi:hypothetical protein